MATNLKIAVFTDSFLPGTGGTENAVINMCYGLQELGHSVKVYCPNYHKEYKNENLDIVRVPSIKLSNNDMAALPSIVKNKLIKSVKEFNPDIIHFCTGSGMAKWATKIGEKLNIPVVGTIHTKFRDAFSASIKSKLIVNAMLKSIAKKLYKCQKVSVVGKCQIADLKSYGYNKDNIEVIKNGVILKEKGLATEKDIEIVKKEYNLDNEIIFLFVGHLAKFKNIQFSLQALALIHSKGFNNFKFIIVGDGPYKKKLEKLIKKLNLTNNVIFTGLIRDRKKLNAIYNTATLFLFPSIFDNDTLVVIESSLNNVPSLVLKDTGPSERLEDNMNGFISENTVNDYAIRILEILNDDELYLKVKNNLSSILTKDWKNVAMDYEKFYREAIDQYNKKDEN